MNIDPLSTFHYQPNTKIGHPDRYRETPAHTWDGDPSEASQLARLAVESTQALKNLPEIRPEVVARGRELLNDPNYPSTEIIGKIASLITPFSDEDLS